MRVVPRSRWLTRVSAITIGTKVPKSPKQPLISSHKLWYRTLFLTTIHVEAILPAGCRDSLFCISAIATVPNHSQVIAGLLEPHNILINTTGHRTKQKWKTQYLSYGDIPEAWGSQLAVKVQLMKIPQEPHTYTNILRQLHEFHFKLQPCGCRCHCW